jgi:hypothetical protein
MNWTAAKITALAGAALLAIGTFLPLVSVPKRGSVTLMQADWAWMGFAMLALAAVGAGLALLGRTRHAMWPGIGALALLAYAFVQASTEIERSRLRLGRGITEDPLAQIGALVKVNSRYEYGWAVMVIGALALIVAGVMAWRAERGSGGG